VADDRSKCGQPLNLIARNDVKQREATWIRKVLTASTRWVRTQSAVEYGVKIWSGECDISQCVLIGQHRGQVGEAARIPVSDLPYLLSLADQVGHQIHCVGVAPVDILGEGVE
jgi:hypothetical protein